MHFLVGLKETNKIYDHEIKKSSKENAKKKSTPKIILKNSKIFKHNNEKSAIETPKESTTEDYTVFVDISDNDSIRTVMEVKMDKETNDNNEKEKKEDLEEEKER